MLDRVVPSCQTGYQYLSEKKSMIRRGKSISPLASIVTSSYQSINYLKAAVHVSIVGLRFPKLVNAYFIQFENDCLDRNCTLCIFLVRLTPYIFYSNINNNQLYSSLELCSEESNEIVLPTEDTDALERYSVSTNSVPRTIVTIH